MIPAISVKYEFGCGFFHTFRKRNPFWQCLVFSFFRFVNGVVFKMTNEFSFPSISFFNVLIGVALKGIYGIHF